MKTPTIKCWDKKLLHGLFGLASLLLLVPQLSYKFYLCANRPAWVHKHRISHTQEPAAGTHLASITHLHCRPLTIDKRYDLKYLFALAPAPAQVHTISCTAMFIEHPVLSAIWNFVPAYRLRGPPPAVVNISAFI
jgi:hypothetical protein